MPAGSPRSLALALVALAAGCGGDGRRRRPTRRARPRPRRSSARSRARREPVTLAGGTRLSDCVVALAQRRRAAGARARPHPGAPTHLAVRAQARRRARRRPRSATSSARRAAARRAPPGIHAELARRMERSAAFLDEGGPRGRRRRSSAACAPGGRRGEAAPLPPPRRRARRLPRGGHRPGARAPALAAAHATASGSRSSRSSPTASGSCSPTCRCTATPRTARATRTRWTGSPRSWPRSASRPRGPRPLVGGHDLGAEILLRAVEAGLLAPAKLVLMPNRLHRPPERAALRSAWRAATRVAAVPGLDRAAQPRRPRACSGPTSATRLSARGNPAARDLVRHAFADVGGNANLARSWATFARALAGARAARAARRLRADRRPDAAAVGRRGPAAPAPGGRGGARPAARRAAARAQRHRLPDRLRRPGRRRRGSSRRSAARL